MKFRNCIFCFFIAVSCNAQNDSINLAYIDLTHHGLLYSNAQAAFSHTRNAQPQISGMHGIGCGIQFLPKVFFIFAANWGTNRWLTEDVIVHRHTKEILGNPWNYVYRKEVADTVYAVFGDQYTSHLFGLSIRCINHNKFSMWLKPQVNLLRWSGHFGGELYDSTTDQAKTYEFNLYQSTGQDEYYTCEQLEEYYSYYSTKTIMSIHAECEYQLIPHISCWIGFGVMETIYERRLQTDGLPFFPSTSFGFRFR